MRLTHLAPCPRAFRRITLALLGGTAVLLSACGGGDSVTPIAAPTPATYALGGTVSGLKGAGLVLQTDAGQAVSIAADGPFVLPEHLAKGTAYAVTVKTQPSQPTQTCSVANAGGTMREADVTDLTVTCATSAFAISGSLSGLAGGSVVIQNNAGDDLTLQADGSFAFPLKVASGAGYAVTVKAQPDAPAQTCTVGNAGGIVHDRNIADVAIVCASATYSIGGSVSGVAGPGLVLQNNAADDLAISDAGTFRFPGRVAVGGAYNVTVKAQPPGLACSVTNGTGAATADVADVQVLCLHGDLGVWVNLSGMISAGLVLQNLGPDDLALAEDGRFKFSKPIGFPALYGVSVKTQPPFATCTVHDGSGIASASDVEVSVTCVPGPAQVSTLQIDGGLNYPNDVAVAADGTIYVTETSNHRIRKIAPNGVASTLAGAGTAGWQDGEGAAALFNRPEGLALDAHGNVFVADSSNQRIRMITPDGVVSTLAGTGASGVADGPATSATFNNPEDVTLDADGNVYVADAFNSLIRKIGTDHAVSTWAGVPGNAGWRDGPGHPDPGQDDQDPGALFLDPKGVAADADGNVYVADYDNNRIRKSTQDGWVSTLAGSGDPVAVDGVGKDASFLTPNQVAVDASGNVYVAERTSSLIRMISPSGVVTTLAGSGAKDMIDGVGKSAAFNTPKGLAVDANGNVFVADTSNHSIRKITPVR